MNLKIYEIFSMQQALNDLYEKNIYIPIKICLKLKLNINKCEEITNLFIDRVKKIFGNEKISDLNKMDESEIKLYNNLLTQEIDIELIKIPIELIDDKTITTLKNYDILSKIIL